MLKEGIIFDYNRIPTREEVEKYIERGYKVLARILTDDIHATSSDIINQGLDNILVPRIICRSLDSLDYQKLSDLVKIPIERLEIIKD